MVSGGYQTGQPDFYRSFEVWMGNLYANSGVQRYCNSMLYLLLFQMFMYKSIIGAIAELEYIRYLSFIMR